MVISTMDSVPASLSDVATYILENGHLDIASDDDLQALYSLCRLGVVSEDAIKAHCQAHGGLESFTYASEKPRVPEQRAIASKLGFKRVSKMKKAELFTLLEPFMSILQYFPVEMARRVKGIMDRKEACKSLEQLVEERKSRAESNSDPMYHMTGWIRIDNFLDILATSPERYISEEDCKRVFHLESHQLEGLQKREQMEARIHRFATYYTQRSQYKLWSVAERAMVLRGGIEGVYWAHQKVENAKQRRREKGLKHRDLRLRLLTKALAKKGHHELPADRRVFRKYLKKTSRPTKEEILETARVFDEGEFFRKHTQLYTFGREINNFTNDMKEDALRQWVQEHRENLEEAMVRCSLPSSLTPLVMEIHSGR